MTHICVGKLTIIGSDNGLSPGRRQAIIWTNAGILLIGPLWTNFCEIVIKISTFSFKKMRLKMSSAKWRLFLPQPQCVKHQMLMFKAKTGEIAIYLSFPHKTDLQQQQKKKQPQKTISSSLSSSSTKTDKQTIVFIRVCLIKQVTYTILNIILQGEVLYWFMSAPYPDSKVHGANMGPTWVLSAQYGPLVGPINLALRVHYDGMSIDRKLSWVWPPNNTLRPR